MAFWTNHNVQPKMKSRFIVNFGTFLLPNVKSISKPSVEISTKEYKLLNHHFNYPGIAKWNPITITFVCMGPGDADSDGDGLDTADMLWKILRNSGYAIPTEDKHAINSNGDKAQMSSPEKLSSGINAFGQGLWDNTITGDKGYTPGGKMNRAPESVVIQQLGSGAISGTADDDGNFPMKVNVTEQWTLHGPIIKSIKFGDLSYEDDNLVEYTLDIAYDYAIHEMDTGVLTSTTWNNFS